MGQWLDALAKTPASGSAPDRLKRAKPAAAVDGCWDLEGDAHRRTGDVRRAGPMQRRCFPSHKNPRLVAGAPLADDITEVRAEAHRRSRLQSRRSPPSELQTLNAIFPRGVCDYTKPGLNQAPLAGTYLKLPLPSRAPVDTQPPGARQ